VPTYGGRPREILREYTGERGEKGSLQGGKTKLGKKVGGGIKFFYFNGRSGSNWRSVHGVIARAFEKKEPTLGQEVPSLREGRSERGEE